MRYIQSFSGISGFTNLGSQNGRFQEMGKSTHFHPFRHEKRWIYGIYAIRGPQNGQF